MSITEEFLARYTREYDYYQEVARLVSSQCEIGMEQAGIRAIVTHRAKRPDRLRDKVQKRDAEKNYSTVEAVYTDLVDLAGARIALYFPGDRTEVDRLIRSQFTVVGFKQFPNQSQPTYEKRFSGYWASHYRVQLKEENVSGTQKRYCQALCEIQVASVLMHAWSEVEHDLVYKPLSGSLSEDEYAILDELNGLVLTGEVALERLQKAVKVRVTGSDRPFESHYELASYLYGIIQQATGQPSSEPVMGRADVLFRFLQLTQLDRPECLAEYLGGLDPNTEDRPVAEQVVDRILTAKPEDYARYAQARQEVGDRNPYSSSDERVHRDSQLLGQFLTQWIGFERFLRDVMQQHKLQTHPWNLKLNLERLSSKGIFTARMLQQIDRVRFIRNQVVHGTESPGDDVIKYANEVIKRVTSDLKAKADRQSLHGPTPDSEEQTGAD